MEPRIAERLTAVWIGGPEYPDLGVPPPPGASGIEYDLNIDLTAARVVFDSPIRSPLVLLTALQSSFQPDPSSSRHVERFAPRINGDGTYTPRASGRRIRVYTDLDVRLMFSDLFVKLGGFRRG